MSTITASISPEIVEKYPLFNVALLRVPMPPNYATDAERGSATERIVGAVKKAFPDGTDPESHPFGAAYNTFYSSMGLKAKKVSTPAKQAGRVLATGAYKSLFKVIDWCMEIEYTSLISFQVYDLDRLNASLTYKLSAGTEELISFHGEVKTCKPGELILCDAEAPVHSVYYGNHRDKSISANTGRVLVRIMGIPNVPAAEFLNAVERFEQFCSPEAKCLLTAETPSGML